MTVGVRPVTDTVKELHGQRVGDTRRPRRGCSRSCPRWCCRPRSWPPSTACRRLDFAELVATLAQRFPVETLEAPAEARRVADEADLRVLEALTAPGAGQPVPGLPSDR